VEADVPSTSVSGSTRLENRFIAIAPAPAHHHNNRSIMARDSVGDGGSAAAAAGATAMLTETVTAASTHSNSQPAEPRDSIAEHRHKHEYTPASDTTPNCATGQRCDTTTAKSLSHRVPTPLHLEKSRLSYRAQNAVCASETVC
jgi:hypothetical protein